MRIISKKTIVDFYSQEKYKDSKKQLEAWFFEASKNVWQNPNDIKEKYKNASILANNRVVFNICGNKYRLIVKIAYKINLVYIRFIGNHKEYDKVNAEEI